MKHYILKVLRFLECIPILGPLLKFFIRIGKAMFSPAGLHSLGMEIKQKVAVFETQQLPALLDSISRINNYFIVYDKTRANFQKSVPVALRRLVQKTNDNTALLESINETLNKHMASDQARHAELLQDVERRLLELKKQDAEKYEALLQRLSTHADDAAK